MSKQIADLIQRLSLCLVTIILIQRLAEIVNIEEAPVKKAHALRQDAEWLWQRAPKRKANENPQETKTRLKILSQAHARLLQAEEVIKRSQEEGDIFEKVYILADLGVSFSKLDWGKEAEESFKAALALGRDSPAFGGRDSPHLIPILQHYAALLERLERAQDAMDVRKEMLRIGEKTRPTGIQIGNVQLSPAWLLLSLLALLSLTLLTVILLFGCSRTLRTSYLRRRFSDEMIRDSAREVIDHLRGQPFDEVVHYACPARTRHFARLAVGYGDDSTAYLHDFMIEVWKDEEVTYRFWSSQPEIARLMRTQGTETRFQVLKEPEDIFWDGWKYSISAKKMYQLAE